MSCQRQLSLIKMFVLILVSSCCFICSCGKGSSDSASASGRSSGGTGTSSACTCSGTCTCDTFTRADSTSTLGSTEGGVTKPWEYTAGTVYGITSHKAPGVSGGSQMADLATVNMALTTCSTQLQITTLPLSGEAIGIAFRTVDGDNTYGFLADMSAIGASNQYTLLLLNSGTPSVLGSCATTPATNDVLKVTISGNTFTATVNASACVSIADATLSGTKFGLVAGSTSARIGTFNVENCQ